MATDATIDEIVEIYAEQARVEEWCRNIPRWKRDQRLWVEAALANGIGNLFEFESRWKTHSPEERELMRRIEEGYEERFGMQMAANGVHLTELGTRSPAYRLAAALKGDSEAPSYAQAWVRGYNRHRRQRPMRWAVRRASVVQSLASLGRNREPRRQRRQSARSARSARAGPDEPHPEPHPLASTARRNGGAT
jgi:hypothetical protein